MERDRAMGLGGDRVQEKGRVGRVTWVVVHGLWGGKYRRVREEGEVR